MALLLVPSGLKFNLLCTGVVFGGPIQSGNSCPWCLGKCFCFVSSMISLSFFLFLIIVEMWTSWLTFSYLFVSHLPFLCLCGIVFFETLNFVLQPFRIFLAAVRCRV